MGHHFRRGAGDDRSSVNRGGFVVLALIFVGLFAVLAGWTAGNIVKAHRADNALQHDQP